jgi:hypothetical protein
MNGGRAVFVDDGGRDDVRGWGFKKIHSDWVGMDWGGEFGQ